MDIHSKMPEREIVIALPAANTSLSILAFPKENETSMLHEKHQAVDIVSSISIEISSYESEKRPALGPFSPPNIQHQAQNQEPYSKKPHVQTF
ncbi:hypothetical protein EJD97_009135 [Solanum chilense]|uniref:Uncharacterized protein n=1 Tax=Solanum chilense TaxID=4083 RepID=A0A6N2CFL0_SOLCI|nr:hypothetical protein EJD97_009135 [Solanum chilense]